MSKKSAVTIFVVTMLVLCTFVLCACVNTAPPNEQLPASHKISIVKDEVYADYYSINSDYSIVGAGKTVTVTVDTWDFLSVDKVYANDTECAPAEDGKYTFEMPDEDVSVKATLKVNVIPSLDDGMTWRDAEALAQPTTLSSGIYVDFGALSIQNTSYANSEGYSTMYYAKVISTNQDVVPDEAIRRIEPQAGNNGMYAVSALISFDVTKVSSGKTILIFVDTFNDRAISIELNVVA